jgi:hypothetical protein
MGKGMATVARGVRRIYYPCSLLSTVTSLSIFQQRKLYRGILHPSITTHKTLNRALGTKGMLSSDRDWFC